MSHKFQLNNDLEELFVLITWAFVPPPYFFQLKLSVHCEPIILAYSNLLVRIVFFKKL